MFEACDFTAPRAFEFGPLGSRGDVTLRSSRLDGDLAYGGGAGGKLQLEQVRARIGRWDVGSSGAPLTIASSRLDGVDLRTTGTSPLTVRGSRLVGGSVVGTPGAPITVQDSHAGGTTMGANVAVLRSRTIRVLS